MTSCEVCGSPLAVGARGRVLKTCGQRACFSELVRRAKIGDANPARQRALADPRPRDKFGRRDLVTATCAVCSTEFLTPRSESIRRKTCSPACAALQNRANQKNRRRRGPANPNFKTGHRVGARDRAGERRWFAGAPNHCENPSCPGPVGRLAAHHCVYRQAVERASGDVWDPRNRLVLCAGCHASHHRGGRRIATTALPDSAIRFARSLMGAGAAYEYLTRRYVAGNDPRVAGLLAEWEQAA